MIIEAGGDLFGADTEALVNPVNTTGVMGKGLALAFKQRFPINFTAYRQACKRGQVTVGTMLVFDRAPESPRWIINFPTKRYWRGSSKLADIRAGLVDLVVQVEQRHITSIAIPALGCGLGGLEWSEVRPLIVNAFARVPHTRVLLYPPGA